MNNLNSKLLFVDKPHASLLNMLEQADFICDYFPDYNRTEVESIIKNYTGLIIRSKFSIDKDFIDKSKHLKFIGREGAGMDNIDVDYAESIGIKCLNSPEGNRDAVGEHTVGLLLALFNKICLAYNSTRTGNWEREQHRGLEIKGRTVAIIGYGNMGKAFAQRLKGFEAHVIAYDKYKTNFSDEFATEVTLQKVFEQADVVSMHVPLTEETRNMVNANFINNFKKNIYLLNTARGKVVNSANLVEGLKSGKIAGSALDVIDYESPSQQFQYNANDPVLIHLLTANNVIITPHVAGWTVESKEKLSVFLGKKIIALLQKN